MLDDDKNPHSISWFVDINVWLDKHLGMSTYIHGNKGGINDNSDGRQLSCSTLIEIKIFLFINYAFVYWLFGIVLSHNICNEITLKYTFTWKKANIIQKRRNLGVIDEFIGL